MRTRLSNAELLFWLILLGYVMFILAASFYSASWNSALQPDSLDRSRLALWINGEITFRHLRDIATNILLYMPLGLLTASALTFRSNVGLFHPAILAGVALSIGVETVQAFVGRFSDPTDVVSNALGHAIGFVLMVVAIKRFRLSPAHLLGLHADGAGVSRSQTLRGIRFLYVAIFMVVAIVPLDFAVGLTQILGKLQPVGGSDPRLILDPWFHWRQSDFPLRSLTLIALSFTPLALLTALIDRSERTLSLSRPILHCVVLACTAELAQVFIASGRSDVIVPLLAAASAAMVAYAVHAMGSRYENLSAMPRQHEASRYLTLLIGLYLIFILSLAWSPYEFESPGNWKQKLIHETNLVPFRLHFSSRSVAAAVDIVREMALFLPLGALLGQLVQTLAGPLRWLPRAFVGGAAGLAVGLLVEGSQSIVVGRYIDVTDALLAAGGCLVGCVAWTAVTPHARSSRALVRKNK